MPCSASQGRRMPRFDAIAVSGAAAEELRCWQKSFSQWLSHRERIELLRHRGDEADLPDG